jgi:hypothetical protein
MYKNEITINEFLKDPIENSDSSYQFYDWFGKSSTLKNKMSKMVPKLKYLVKSGIIDGDNCYVWFKENCTLNALSKRCLNVDMRISKLEPDNVYLGGFNPNLQNICDHGMEVFYKDKTGGNFIVEEFQNWKEFKSKIRNDLEFKEVLTDAFL